MKKLFIYLKQYYLWLILCVIFLFGQALGDLSLPHLMSDIVNIGIQQGGIEETAPAALSRNAMTLMRTFMTEQDRQAVDAGYTLVLSGSDDARLYRDKYPAVKTGDIYVRGTGSLEMLGAAFGRAAMTLSNYMKELASKSGQSLTDNKHGEGLDDIDLSPLYAMQPMLDRMPSAAFEKARAGIGDLDDTLLSQVGVVMVRQFYKELGVDTDGIRIGYIVKTGAAMLLLTLAGAFATVMVALISSRVAADVARRMRHDIFSRVESFSNAEFDRFSTASLITRTTNDVTQVQMLIIMGIRIVCYAPIMGIGGIFMAVSKSLSMSWIIAVAVLVLIGIIYIVFLFAMPKFKIVQKLIDKLNLVMREHLSGIMVIRAFNTQQFEHNRFKNANRELTDVMLFVNRVMVIMMPAMMFLMNVVGVLIVWVGAHQIESAAIKVGDMVAFTQYAIQIIISFLMISMMFIMVPRAAVSAERIAEVLDTEPEINDPPVPKLPEDNPKGEIEFHHVSFKYGNAKDYVLHDLNFVARPGQTTAFIGSTGSGKSTLVNLIPRFYDVTGGRILIDGVDIREMPQQKLREMIGYIPQKGILFSGDIASNLRYGRQDASDEEVLKAAETAQAQDFILSSEKGIQSPISQGGANVSGGQKQRLAIARALMKNAPIYIFDDSFSALDFKTDAALRRELKEQTGKSTVLIVAQRVGTIMNAEQIIVLDEGRIVGKGTHRELLETCETYREIASSQLTKEELA